MRVHARVQVKSTLNDTIVEIHDFIMYNPTKDIEDTLWGIPLVYRQNTLEHYHNIQLTDITGFECYEVIKQ